MIFRGLFVMVIATPALADCPVSGDLATVGIALVQSNGTREVFRAAGPGEIEVRGQYDDGYEGWTLLARGVYLLRVADVIDGRIDEAGMTRTEFGMPSTDIPAPKPGSSWKMATTVTDPDGQYAETVSAVWGARTSMAFGACLYDVIPGTIRYTGTDYPAEEGLHYLPQLGIAYLRSYDDAQMDMPEKFTVTSITKASE